MEAVEKIMPTHIVAVAGVVTNDNGRPKYLSYVTRPSFDLKLKREI